MEKEYRKFYFPREISQKYYYAIYNEYIKRLKSKINSKYINYLLDILVITPIILIIGITYLITKYEGISLIIIFIVLIRQKAYNHDVKEDFALLEKKYKSEIEIYMKVLEYAHSNFELQKLSNFNFKNKHLINKREFNNAIQSLNLNEKINSFINEFIEINNIKLNWDINIDLAKLHYNTRFDHLGYFDNTFILTPIIKKLITNNSEKYKFF